MNLTSPVNPMYNYLSVRPKPHEFVPLIDLMRGLLSSILINTETPWSVAYDQIVVRNDTSLREFSDLVSKPASTSAIIEALNLIYDAYDIVVYSPSPADKAQHYSIFMEKEAIPHVESYLSIIDSGELIVYFSDRSLMMLAFEYLAVNEKISLKESSVYS